MLEKQTPFEKLNFFFYFSDNTAVKVFCGITEWRPDGGGRYG